MAQYKNVEGYRNLFEEKYKEIKKMINEGRTQLDCLAGGFSEAGSIIDNIPTADVVEVVRCKDCKYWLEQEFKGFCSIHFTKKFANDFCSYGKRGEEKVLSERQEKRKRQIQRMRHSMAVCQWRSEEPCPLLVWRWIKWKRNKPKLEDFKAKE